METSKEVADQFQAQAAKDASFSADEVSDMFADVPDEDTGQSIEEQGKGLLDSKAQEKATMDASMDKFQITEKTEEAGADGQKSVKEKVTKLRDWLYQNPSAGFGPIKGPMLGYAMDVGLQNVQDLGNSLLDLGNATEEYLAKNNFGDGKLIDDNFKFDIMPQAQSAGEAFARGAGQFASLMQPVGAAMKSAKVPGYLAKFGQWSASAAVAGITADPDNKNLADWASDVPYMSLIIPDIAKSKPEDTRLERRLKNMGIDGALGIGAGAVFMGIGKSFGKRAAVQKSEAAISQTKQILNTSKNADEVIKNIEKMEAAAKPVELPVGKAAALEKIKQEGTTLGIDDIIREADIRKEMQGDKMFMDMLEGYKGGARTFEQDLDVALKTIIDTPEKAEKFVIDKLQPGVALNGPEVAAASYLTTKARKDLNDLVATLPLEMSDEQALQLSFAELKAKSFDLSLTGAGSMAGRALSYMKGVDVADSSYVEQFTKLAKENAKEKLLYMKMAEFSKDVIPDEIRKELPNFVLDEAKGNAGKAVMKSSYRKLQDVAYSLFTNGAMAKVNSLANNVLGNMSMVAENAATYAAAAMPWSPVTWAEANMKAAGQFHAILEAFQAGGKVFMAGKMPKGYASNFGLQGSVYTTSDLESGWLKTVIGAIGATNKGQKVLSGATTVAKGTETVQRAMGATDMVSKVIMGRGEQHALMYHTAHQTAKKLKLNTDAGQKMYREMLANPPAIYDLASVNYANKVTFAREIKELGWIGEATKGVNMIANVVTVGNGRMFVPFTKTLANLADTGLQYSGPFSVLSKTIRSDLAAGGRRSAIAQGRIAVGTGIVATGSFFNAAGWIQGNKRRDVYAERALQLGDSYGVDAAVINGQMEPISSLAPLAFPLLLGSDIADMMRYSIDEEDDEMISHIGNQAIVAMMDRLAPEYLTGSFRDLINNLEAAEEGKTGDKLKTGAAQMLSTMVPYRFVYKNMADFLKKDPKKKDTSADPDTSALIEIRNEFWNKVRADFGGGEDLPDMVNIFGEPIEPPKGFSWGMMSAVFSPDEKDEVNQGLRKLGLDAPYLGKAPEGEKDFRLKMPSRLLVTDIEGPDKLRVQYKMTPKEYNQFLMFMNKGGHLKSAIGGILKNEYMIDEDKKQAIIEIISDAKKDATSYMKGTSKGFSEKYQGTAKKREKVKKKQLNMRVGP